jgi:uncharacterized protein YeaO (DUF488 family)
MIKIKHLFEAAEKDDGERIWVESINLTKDLREWCAVSHVLTNLGPPRDVWERFQEHPDGYEHFRGRYHEYLADPKRRRMLMAFALAGLNETFTLLHQGDDPEHNSATALYEFLSELQAYKQPE